MKLKRNIVCPKVLPAPSESSLPVSVWQDICFLLCQVLILTNRITFFNYVNDLSRVIFTIFILCACLVLFFSIIKIWSLLFTQHFWSQRCSQTWGLFNVHLPSLYPNKSRRCISHTSLSTGSSWYYSRSLQCWFLRCVLCMSALLTADQRHSQLIQRDSRATGVTPQLLHVCHGYRQPVAKETLLMPAHLSWKRSCTLDSRTEIITLKMHVDLQAWPRLVNYVMFL